jgi:aryl-phospho-beta-D-glucosidase BglC (GH1 family)
VFALFLACFIFLQVAASQDKAPSKKPDMREWWNARHPGDPLNSPQAKKLPRISVRGNRFVDPSGNVLLLKGLSISDPDKIEYQGHWGKAHFEKVKGTGTQVVRIPVHPIAWRLRTPAGYLALLDQAVEWCTELGMYVIIDWHTIGNLKTGLYQDPMYNTSRTETFEFWRAIARHFSGNNTVAFYELFNEPTLYFHQLGRMSWAEWREVNEDLIAMIRSFDREAIPLVAGLDWAYDLTPLRDDPVRAENIAYVTHPYPHKRNAPWEPKWEEDFGFAAGWFPIIATEIGFTAGKEGLADNGPYGNAILDYLEGKGISWVAWVYDPEWGPAMLKSWDTYALTENGEFFVKAMQGMRKKTTEAQIPVK